MAQTKSEAYLQWLNKPGNREKKNAQKREWNLANRDRVKAYKAEYKTPEVKAADYATHLEWKKKNPERLKVYNKRSVEKLRNDPAALVRKEMRRVIYDALKGKSRRGILLEKLIGCSKLDFMKQLESKFKDGMTWGNYGSHWQVDHIKPLILFNVHNPDEYVKASHYSNLQPLLAVENLKKGKNFDELFESVKQ